jgi:hypothetical protein
MGLTEQRTKEGEIGLESFSGRGGRLGGIGMIGSMIGSMIGAVRGGNVRSEFHSVA